MRWLLVPVALVLDGLTARYFAGHRHPLGLTIPEGLLAVAPLLAYGGLAFGVFRTRPLRVRLATLAVLLGLHAGLVALHVLGFAILSSVPVRAAVRLAHRWSPLIPLLQLIWVPLLASPLASLVPPAPRARVRRGGALPARRSVGPSSGVDSDDRAYLEGDRDHVMMLPSPPLGPVVDAVVGTELPVPAWVEPEPRPAQVFASSGALVGADAVFDAAPTMGHDAPAAVADTPVAVDVEPVARISVDVLAGAPVVVDAEPAAAATLEVVTDAPVESVTETAAMVEMPVDLSPIAVSEEPLRAGDLAPEVLAPEPSPVAAVPAPVEPPLDLSGVGRIFEPYGSLLSRAGEVLVDWMPGPRASIVCVAPRAVSRERLLDLARRLVEVLPIVDVAGPQQAVRRLSFHASDGAVVLTLLDGGILVAAASRPGALGLLEVLSDRAVPGSTDAPCAGGRDRPHAPSEITVTEAVRIETGAATLDVLAPVGTDPQLHGALASRLLGAIGDDGHWGACRNLGIDVGVTRLMVHPVRPDAHPPRFVVVIGSQEPPGLLARRAERAALTLREAS